MEKGLVISGNSDNIPAYGWLSCIVLIVMLEHSIVEHRLVNLVKLSINLLLFKSTSNPKCFSKSAPIIGFVTSAITNGQQYGRRKPRLG